MPLTGLVNRPAVVGLGTLLTLLAVAFGPGLMPVVNHPGNLLTLLAVVTVLVQVLLLMQVQLPLVQPVAVIVLQLVLWQHLDRVRLVLLVRVLALLAVFPAVRQ